MARLALTREKLIDLLVRMLVGTLFLLLSMNLLEDFVRTQRITGLLLLVSESLVVVLTVMRRRAYLVDTSAAALTITAIALVGPPLLRTGDAPGLVPDALTALVSSAAICLVIAGKLTLGRSFGIVPANRGIVDKGPYLLVRHPIYAGYLVSHMAFVAAYPQPWNIAVLIISDSALVWRALFEERLLRQDERYQAYCGRVGWHLVPGLF
jgi:protein-S-isoprenylcysteine O-methyltransferase Ste14